MKIEDMQLLRLALGYGLLLFPLGIMLWYRLGITGRTAVAVLRMTVQLLFVGFYLQVLFEWNNPWMNVGWVMVMILVADVSITRSCGLSLKRFVVPLFGALLVGTAIPLLIFVGMLLTESKMFDAQYLIPIGGMILGNCLRADVVGLSRFYSALRDKEKVYLQSLADGASLHEALRPFVASACRASLEPTIATIGTIGLVSLPGMMTGVILGGAEPTTAIKYQIAIMIAIFTGTSITVVLAVWLTVISSFNAFGVLDKGVFVK